MSAVEEEMVFDTTLKRLVPASYLWSQHAELAEDVTARAGSRLVDLNTLLGTLREARTIAAVRERDTIDRLNTEAELLIHIIRARQAELAKVVHEVTVRQTTSLDELILRAATMQEELATRLEKVESGQKGSIHMRLASLYELEENVKLPVFFDTPSQVLFDINVAALKTEECLTMAQVQVPTPIPSSLAVRMANESEVELMPDPTNRGPFGVSPGILHYLATSGGVKPFRNPHEEGLVTVTADFVCGTPAHLVRDCTSTASLSSRPVRTRSDREGRILFDFGQRKVAVDRYSLQHGHEERHAALSNWCLVASDDGHEWIVLDRRINEDALGQRPFGSVLFDTSKEADGEAPAFLPPSSAPCNRYYRYIAIEITGANASGPDNYHIEVAHVEFYGRLRAL